MTKKKVHSTQITGVILAGGKARRLGGQDKGLIEICGKTMIEYGICTLSPQVQTLIISANRNIERYCALGYLVTTDHFGAFEGPLAGLRQSLMTMKTPLLATLPCDAPLAPKDFVARLYTHFSDEKMLAAIAHDGERLQPLFGLFSSKALASLNDYLASGGRKVHDWVVSLSPVLVDFSDCREAFRNINTSKDLQAIQAQIQDQR